MSFDVNETRPRAADSSPEDGKTQEPEVFEPGHSEEENDFRTLLAAYEGRSQTFSEGEVIKGKIIAISGGGVVVDVGFKSEGIIPTEQFLDESGRCAVKVGDVVDVFLEATEDSQGYVVLSREKAERMK